MDGKTSDMSWSRGHSDWGGRLSGHGGRREVSNVVTGHTSLIATVTTTSNVDPRLVPRFTVEQIQCFSTQLILKRMRMKNYKVKMSGCLM